MTVTSTVTGVSPYQGYVYAYPHKTAYRPLDPAPALRDVWAGERLDALFLYLHVPFCEMRCGFCNLFTRTGAPEELTGAYLDALDRQATAVLDALHAAGGPDGASFATAAFGGGTPTYLTAPELERLCDIAGRFPDSGRGRSASRRPRPPPPPTASPSWPNAAPRGSPSECRASSTTKRARPSVRRSAPRWRPH